MDLRKPHSIDELFLEQPFAVRWQVLTVFLCSCVSIYSGCYVISPEFYRFSVPYTCANADDGTTHEDMCRSDCSTWQFNYTGLDRKTSLQETFNLVCDDEIFLKLHGSLYFLGLCFGSVIGGYLSDRIGRARWYRVATVVGSCSQVLMALTTSLFVHLAAWCFISAIMMSSMMGLFALGAEQGRSAHRHLIAAIMSSIFSISLPIAAPLAYAFPDWRHFFLSLSVLMFLCFIVSNLIDESVRWLWEQKRYEEVYAILQRAYKLSNKTVPAEIQELFENDLIPNGFRKESFFVGIISDLKRVAGIHQKQSIDHQTENLKIEIIEDTNEHAIETNGNQSSDGSYELILNLKTNQVAEKEMNKVSANGITKSEPAEMSLAVETERKTYSILDIFGYSRLTIRLILLAMHWVCANTMYYGLSFGAEMFNQNVYIFVMTQGVAGIIGSFLGLFALNFVGRRTLSCATLVFAGICYVACVFIPLSESGIILLITSSAKVSLELFFLICYLWTSDLMPTVIRTSGMGVASSMARITGLALPFVGYLSKFGNSIPLLFYCTMAFTVSILTLFLPESKGKKLPNTLEEGNNFGTKYCKLSENIFETNMNKTETKDYAL